MSRIATTYVDYQQRAAGFEVGDRVTPYFDGAGSDYAGEVTAVWPAIGMVDVEFPHGSKRYPAEELQILEKAGQREYEMPQSPSVPGGVGSVSVSGGPRSRMAREVVALYWAQRDRKYRPCRSESDEGRYTCPRCRNEEGERVTLVRVPYKRTEGRSERILSCPSCTFIIKDDDILSPEEPTDIEVEVEVKMAAEERDLYGRLVRLAYENPELRGDLLPLLKSAGCEKLPDALREQCEKKVEEGKKNDKEAATRFNWEGELLTKAQVMAKAIGKEVVFIGGKDKPTFHAVMNKEGSVFKITAKDYEKSTLKDVSRPYQLNKYYEFETKRLAQSLSIRDSVEYGSWAQGKSLEEKLKKLRSMTASEANARTASSSYEVLGMLGIGYTQTAKVYGQIEETDEQTAELLGEVISELSKYLTLGRGQLDALKRMQALFENYRKWDPALIRNNVFKAANSMGMRLPSGMF